MILGAAFCPHPPVLVPELAGNAAGELGDLRAACTDVIGQIVDLGGPLVVLGSAPMSVSHSALSRGTLAGFGLPMQVHLGAPTCDGDLDLPLSLTVGAWLLGQVAGPPSGVRGFSVGPDFDGSCAAVELLNIAEREDVALLVMGDGSARRSTSAPGYLDERAEQFDRTVATALGAADCATLELLDAELGATLLAAGVPAWQAAARLMDGTRFDARLIYDAAPYGVGYFVARWLARA